jgi:hypothetical protein
MKSMEGKRTGMKKRRKLECRSENIHTSIFGAGFFLHSLLFFWGSLHMCLLVGGLVRSSSNLRTLLHIRTCD